MIKNELTTNNDLPTFDIAEKDMNHHSVHFMTMKNPTFLFATTETSCATLFFAFLQASKKKKDEER